MKGRDLLYLLKAIYHGGTVLCQSNTANEILSATNGSKDPQAVANELISRGLYPKEGIGQLYHYYSLSNEACLWETDKEAEALCIYFNRVLIAAGFKPDTYALMNAMYNRRHDEVLLLLEHGVPVQRHADDFDVLDEAVCRAASLPVLEALTGCFLPQLKLLVSHGANPRALGTAGGYSLLHTSAKFSCVHMLRYLVTEIGLDINVPDEEGRTPIFDAHDPEVVQCCAQLGANVNHINNKGITSLGKAVNDRGCPSDHRAGVVHALLRAGANPNICGSKKTHPLSLLVDAHFELTLLLSYGASPLLSGGVPYSEHIVYPLHVETTLKRCLAEIHDLHHRNDPRIVAKIDTSSDFGDVALPMSLPYHRLPEWFAALRKFVSDGMCDFLRQQEKESLSCLARAIEATPAAIRLKEEMAERDCGTYQPKKMKKSI
jgi:ankyrin repeat protein